MTDNTEKTVLMKCERCGYEEEVPQKDLDLLRSVDKDPEHCEDHLLLCLYYDVNFQLRLFVPGLLFIMALIEKGKVPEH